MCVSPVTTYLWEHPYIWAFLIPKTQLYLYLIDIYCCLRKYSLLIINFVTTAMYARSMRSLDRFFAPIVTMKSKLLAFASGSARSNVLNHSTETYYYDLFFNFDRQAFDHYLNLFYDITKVIVYLCAKFHSNQFIRQGVIENQRINFHSQVLFSCQELSQSERWSWLIIIKPTFTL